jgi:hypothetical protein
MRFFANIENLTDAQLIKRTKFWRIQSWVIFAIGIFFLCIAVYLTLTLPNLNGVTVTTPADAANLTLSVMVNIGAVVGSAAMFVTYFLFSGILDRKTEFMELTLKIRKLEKQLEEKQ